MKALTGFFFSGALRYSNDFIVAVERENLRPGIQVRGGVYAIAPKPLTQFAKSRGAGIAPVYGYVYPNRGSGSSSSKSLSLSLSLSFLYETRFIVRFT